MKWKTIWSLVVLVPVLASAEILVGWHSPDDGGTTASVNDATPDTAVSGVSGHLGFLQGGYDVTTWANSTDGSYGTTAIPGSPATARAVMLKVNSDAQRRLDIEITNNTGSDLRLDTLHFDYTRAWPNSPTDISVFHMDLQSDLVGNGFTSIFAVSGLSSSSGSGAGDYDDVDADMAVLNDRVLANGESAAFRIQVSGGQSDNAMWIDNIAFSGSVIPEPAALGLVALAGAGCLAVRRLFML